MTPDSERSGLIGARDWRERLRRFGKPACELEPELEQHNTLAKRQQSSPSQPGSVLHQADLVGFGRPAAAAAAAAAADSAVVVAVPGAAVGGVDPIEVEAEPDVDRSDSARLPPARPSPVDAARAVRNMHSKPLHVPLVVVLPSRHSHILVQPVETHDSIVAAGTGRPARSELSCHV